MIERPLRTTTSTLDIYIKLAQYPILSERIRLLMRQELFKRGVIGEDDFETEVKRKAKESQQREGIYDELSIEPASVWRRRKDRIRDYLTDFYFGYNLPNELFDQIVHMVLQDRESSEDVNDLTFNPELAPWHMLFQQGEIYENLPPNERVRISHHLEEIKVVLIKGMISDQLPYIGVAKKVFTIADLRKVYNRRIGDGKIGGKAAGMLLAWKILQQQNPEFGPDLSDQVNIPDSYFLGTDVIYEFRSLNGLNHFMNQKYRPLDEIRENFPYVEEQHRNGLFPEQIVDQLSEVLVSMGNTPVIVRSSSLLEDNFGYSFAGKYSSYFCPNQGTHSENLDFLLDSIRRIYASNTNPDAILYRRHHGLIDYDERMAILIQAVHGERHKQYYFPPLAGVGFSQNPFRWNPIIRREEGFLRLVWGMGTRAVDRVDRDYPRLIALSHPQLRPETTAKAIRQYSQRYIDVIDTENNSFTTLDTDELLNADYPYLRFIASEDNDEYLKPIVSVSGREDVDYVLTFERLSKDRSFIKLMRTALMRLEQQYGTPVDVEFTVEFLPGRDTNYRLHILQCRPLSMRVEGGPIVLPKDVAPEDTLFTSIGLIPHGKVEGIRYLIFIDPEKYAQIGDPTTKLEVGRCVSRLNKRLEDEVFGMMGPGRWGSANIDLGVRVTYSDIYNTKVLIELGIPGEHGMPDLSYGTHFFQDLVEGGIFSLPLHLEDGTSSFNWDFFKRAPNQLAALLPNDAALAPYVKVIDVNDETGRCINLFMDSQEDKAIAVLSEADWEAPESDVPMSVF